MDGYEYTVIPAPARAGKGSPGKTSDERFAATLAEALNAMAAEGWEYVRAEVLPAEERSGLTGRSTVYHNLLVFRRALAGGPDGARQMPGSRAVLSGEAAGASAPGAGGQPGQAGVAEAAPHVAASAQDEPAPRARHPQVSDEGGGLAAPVRTPFSRAMPAPAQQAPAAPPRASEPPLTRPRPAPVMSGGPRLGPASR